MAFNTNLLTHSTLIFLFFNVFSALLLHVSRLPFWLIMFSMAALALRVFMFSGRVPKPNRVLKSLLVGLGFYGIYITYGINPTIESMVSLLIAGVMLKPLEVEKHQHAYLLIFLNYFLCALLFLFDRTPLDFLLVILVMILTLGSQVLVHQYEQPNRSASLRLGFVLLLKSLPLAIILFLFLPRLGPLWTLNIPTQSGVVGLSDSMSPGSIAQLGENDELAFRVKVFNDSLPMKQRYWRAFTLSEFDGESWQQGRFYQTYDNSSFFDINKPSLRYEVMIEPHEEKWLFALGASKPLVSGVSIQNDATLEKKKKLYSQWQYQVESNVSEMIPQIALSKSERIRYTRIPNDSNLKAQLFAQDLKQKSSNLTEYISLLESFISKKEFSYTLSPGVYGGDDQIDDFLFQSRSGFCSYYAGSVAFLLRSVGVPTRVVVGYMGGEENTLTNTLSIYQYDAHAWVEVYFESEGWLRIDPTSWVAPERVEAGLQQAIPNEFKGFKGQAQWLKELRARWQAFDYVWSEWMLSYKGNRQQTILKDIWGDRTPNELIVILIVVFTVLSVGLFSFLWWDQRSKSKTNERKIFDLLYQWLLSTNNAFASRSDGIQIINKDGLTLKMIFDQLIFYYPHLKDGLKGFNDQLNQVLYQSGAQGLNKQKTRQLIKMIKILRKQA